MEKKEIKLSELTDEQLELKLSVATDTYIFTALLREIAKRKPNDSEFGKYIRALLYNS